MLNNLENISQSSLNEAFELIKNIFNKERNLYEKTINTLKNRISELEEALNNANKDNMKYQSKISKLKEKLNSISKTVSKLEESDFDIKNDNQKNEKAKIIINMDNLNNNIKYRNIEKNNSFRRKTKYLSNINRSASGNFNQYIKNSFLDTNNNKQFNNGEDIKTNYNFKPNIENNQNNQNKQNKKELTSKIKDSLLNAEQTEQRIIYKRNNLFKTYARVGDNNSVYLYSNGYDEKNKDMILLENYEKKGNVNKVKYLSSEKYNKIEQKIKGIKSGLNIYKEKEENKLNYSMDNNTISNNEENNFI